MVQCEFSLVQFSRKKFQPGNAFPMANLGDTTTTQWGNELVSMIILVWMSPSAAMGRLTGIASREPNRKQHKEDLAKFHQKKPDL